MTFNIQSAKPKQSFLFLSGYTDIQLKEIEHMFPLCDETNEFRSVPGNLRI